MKNGEEIPLHLEKPELSCIAVIAFGDLCFKTVTDLQELAAAGKNIIITDCPSDFNPSFNMAGFEHFCGLDAYVDVHGKPCYKTVTKVSHSHSHKIKLSPIRLSTQRWNL